MDMTDHIRLKHVDCPKRADEEPDMVAVDWQDGEHGSEITIFECRACHVKISFLFAP